jgi:hypothetical protein
VLGPEKGTMSEGRTPYHSARLPEGGIPQQGRLGELRRGPPDRLGASKMARCGFIRSSRHWRHWHRIRSFHRTQSARKRGLCPAAKVSRFLCGRCRVRSAGSLHLYGGSPHPHQSGVCWRLSTARRSMKRRRPEGNFKKRTPAPSHRRMGGAASGTSSRLHRLGHLSSQSRAHR